MLSCAIWEWLRSFEFLAIWLEGIALVLIFIWDRIDAKMQHAQMVEQLEISRTAERAWIMAELKQANGPGLLVATASGSSKPQTHFHVDLICRNEGKTPAWITRLTGYSEIVSEATLAKIGPADLKKYANMDWDISIGADKEEERYIEFVCDGSIQGTSDCLSIFLLVEYRDIFARTRTTSIAYFIQHANAARRLQSRDRNKNT